MKQSKIRKTKGDSQHGQGFDDGATCQCKIFTHLEFNLGLPNIFPVKNKGKSPVSSHGMNRIENPVVRKRNGSHNENEIEFYQNKQKQYQIFITI